MEDTELDPYATQRDFAAIVRARNVENIKPPAPPLQKTYDPTLEVILLRPKNERFDEKSKERNVAISVTHRKLPYSLWLQKGKSPLITIIPGIGTNRDEDPSVALAELFFHHGYSVVSISSAMSWEFIENASSAAVPGYPVVDAREVATALQAIDRDLREHYPNRFSSSVLFGYSLGGLHTLLISTFEDQEPAAGLHYDRYVAISPPVDLLYALRQLDAYYNAPLAWPADQRKAKMRQTLLQAARLFDEDYQPTGKFSFDALQSQYLIGLTYRGILRDIIFASQKTHPRGVVQARFSGLRLQPTYDLLNQYSYADYLNLFVTPYYQGQAKGQLTREELLRLSDLHWVGARLKANPKLRVFANRNDFIMRRDDLAWLQSTLDRRLTVFPDGGHMGNLHLPEVQEKIVQGLTN